MEWVPLEVPFDGNNALMMRNINGRTEELLREEFSKYGEVIYLKTIEPVNMAIIAFKTEEQARRARNESSEDVFFAEEELPDPQLHVPERDELQLMTSPPPSPPEGWTPKAEDINRIPYTDLQETKLSDKQTLLLERTSTTPRITISLPPS